MWTRLERNKFAAMMKLLVLLFVFFVLGAQAQYDVVTLKDLINVHNRGSGRIINGQLAEAGQFPYQVAVYYRRAAGGLYFCGGTLVSDQYVLTAGHCAADATLFTIFLGSTRLNSVEQGVVNVEVNAAAATIHPGYNSVTLNNDIALIRLPFALELTERISPIRLPQRGELTPVGSQLVVSGWGITENSASIVSDLLYTTVTSISNLQCAAVYGTTVVVDSTLCTLGSPQESPCSGDSGGPLVSLAGSEPTLAGVISFIHRDGCASGNPAGYVRVEAQLDFILDIVQPEPGPTVVPDDMYE